MRQDKKLMIGMTLLFLITFIFLGTLVTTEKLSPYFTNKINEKFKKYLEEKYPNEIENFIITYKNKKITDTYKNDYLKGKTILKTIEQELQQKIKNKINKDVTISFPLTLDKYTDKEKEKIIKQDLNHISLYNIKFSINNTLEPTSIMEKINTITEKLTEININPNQYTVIINDNNKKLTIYNLTKQTIEKNNLIQIIDDIINNNESEIIKINNITYQYTNKEI